MIIIEIDGVRWIGEEIIFDNYTRMIVIKKPKKYNYTEKKYDEQPYQQMLVPINKITRILEFDESETQM